MSGKALSRSSQIGNQGNDEGLSHSGHNDKNQNQVQTRRDPGHENESHPDGKFTIQDYPCEHQLTLFTEVRNFFSLFYKYKNFP